MQPYPSKKPGVGKEASPGTERGNRKARVLLSGLLGGVFMVTQTAMIADAVDEIKNRTGQNREGVCFSGLTFSSKIMTAVATGVFSLIIYAVGYESGVEITTHMKDMVFLSISLIPAASSLIACVPFFFYPEAPRPAPRGSIKENQSATRSQSWNTA